MNIGELSGGELSYSRQDRLEVFNSFLEAASASLEFLCVRAWRYQYVHVPDQLQCLQLKSDMNVVRFLVHLSEGRQFPQLRSLELGTTIDLSAAQLSTLQHLPYLEHLDLRTVHTVESETNLIESLPHLKLESLKSIVIGGGSPRLIKAVIPACPQLEHLGWKSPNIYRSPERKATMLESLGARLTHLRSLEIDDFVWLNSSWGWLEAQLERGKLEYLNINARLLPARLFYKTIRKCPKLRVISAVGEYSARKIVTAAMETKTSTGGEPLSALYCCVQTAKQSVGRVIFLDRRHKNPPKSHIRHHHRYGCLSEGKPKWKEMQ